MTWSFPAPPLTKRGNDKLLHAYMGKVQAAPTAVPEIYSLLLDRIGPLSAAKKEGKRRKHGSGVAKSMYERSENREAWKKKGSVKGTGTFLRD